MMDEKEVSTVLTELPDGSGVKACHVHRIGRHIPGKSRLVYVVLNCESEKKSILYNAKKLRMPPYRNVFVNPDLIGAQREINNRLRSELKNRREKGEDVLIRNGKIVARHRVENFRYGFYAESSAPHQ